MRRDFNRPASGTKADAEQRQRGSDGDVSRAIAYLMRWAYYDGFDDPKERPPLEVPTGNGFAVVVDVREVAKHVRTILDHNERLASTRIHDLTERGNYDRMKADENSWHAEFTRLRARIAQLEEELGHGEEIEDEATTA